MRYIFGIAAMLVVMAAPAYATGTVRIQQHNDTVQNYTGVNMRIVKKTLLLTSEDKISTVEISGGSCTDADGLKRCNAKQLSLQQSGSLHVIPFVSATFYFNLTDQDETLPLSTTKVPANSVLFAAKTIKGTYITGSGKLDGRTSQ
jgi:hypothetical protein